MAGQFGRAREKFRPHRLNPLERDLFTRAPFEPTPESRRWRELEAGLRLSEHPAFGYEPNATNGVWRDRIQGYMAEKSIKDVVASIPNLFEKDFKAWLVGRPDKRHMAKSMWQTSGAVAPNREVNFMGVPSARRFVETERQQAENFEVMLEVLKQLGPVGLYGEVDDLSLYLYFKYIVDEQGMSNDFLTEWRMINGLTNMYEPRLSALNDPEHIIARQPMESAPIPGGSLNTLDPALGGGGPLPPPPNPPPPDPPPRDPPPRDPPPDRPDSITSNATYDPDADPDGGGGQGGSGQGGPKKRPVFNFFKNVWDALGGNTLPTPGDDYREDTLGLAVHPMSFYVTEGNVNAIAGNPVDWTDAQIDHYAVEARERAMKLRRRIPELYMQADQAKSGAVRAMNETQAQTDEALYHRALSQYYSFLEAKRRRRAARP